MKSHKIPCPSCHQVKAKVSRLPTPPGYDPKLRRYRCDLCRFEWYEMPHATGKVYGLTAWPHWTPDAAGS